MHVHRNHCDRVCDHEDSGTFCYFPLPLFCVTQLSSQDEPITLARSRGVALMRNGAEYVICGGTLQCFSSFGDAIKSLERPGSNTQWEFGQLTKEERDEASLVLCQCEPGDRAFGIGPLWCHWCATSTLWEASTGE